ncbi:MAG: class I SAM-dependent methyltransferase, partial [Burkholderiaceae bacterium]
QEPQHRALYEAVFAQLGLGAGVRYCDIGCASGVAAQMAAERGAVVAGLDAAENLIEIARERVPAGDFRFGEMEALPFDDGVFDVVTGFSAFSYAARPLVALAEARRVARRDGRVVMQTWGQPDEEGVASLIEALTPLLPPRPEGRPWIYALSDEPALRAFVESVGLKALHVETLFTTWTYPDHATALRAFASSGRAVRAIECTSEAAVNDANAAALAPYRRADGSYRVGASFIWVVART